jgi:hypothetical protein
LRLPQLRRFSCGAIAVAKVLRLRKFAEKAKGGTFVSFNEKFGYFFDANCFLIKNYFFFLKAT